MGKSGSYALAMPYPSLLADTSSIPSSPRTGFGRVDALMAQSRAKYAANPELVAQLASDAVAKLQKPLPPTPEVLDFNERLDRAVAGSSQLLEELRAQLAALISEFLPAELTLSEVDDKEAAESWADGYRMAAHNIERMLAKNQTLFDEIIKLIDELAQVPSDVEVLSMPRTPTLEELNVPRQVRKWTADSKAPIARSRTSNDVETDEGHASVDALKQQIDGISARLMKARKLADSTERGKAKVPDLIALYDGFAPCRAPPHQADNTVSYSESFAPCRSGPVEITPSSATGGHSPTASHLGAKRV
ncbi:hypothetical protein LTR85_004316 [Meristemomyces frigidus]|nr:hypothetical protein LTR85_004316 [Meristemomyces frigidus]